MALDFPASPGPGQTFVAGGVTWTWDGAKWVFQGAAGSGVYLPLSGGTISGNLTVQGSTSVQALTCTSINGAPAVFPAMRNRLINGAMRVDQRNGGAAINAMPSGVLVYPADRWHFDGTAAGKFNAGLNLGAVAPPAGFRNYLGFSVAATFAVAATDYFEIQQVIEGLNIADLGWGAAGAQAVTLSFQVRSSVTGTHSGALFGNAGTRSYPFTFSIPAANTWTLISLTVPGDTSGTWAIDSTGGLSVRFCLGAGGTFRGAAGAWGAGNLIGVTGGVNVVATANATFQFTGVQLEAGSVATPYEWRHIGLDLALCQRYYQRYIVTIAGGGFQLIGNAYAAGMYVGTNLATPPMRAAPTLNQIGTWVNTNCAGPTWQIGASGNVVFGYTTSIAAGSVQTYPPAAGGFELVAEL